MSIKLHAVLMARYNQWQNETLLDAADRLDSNERRLDRGAHFGSIERTFAHLYWGDRIWMSRFSPAFLPPGDALSAAAREFADWDGFRRDRSAFDQRILDWASAQSDDWFAGDLEWRSVTANKTLKQPKYVLIAHFFNHQTHHRGQIHAMLTAAGVAPGVTDIPMMPRG